VDFTNTTSASFLRANARGQKLVAIANTQEKVQIEIVLSKAFADKAGFAAGAPLEKRLAALKGARVAVDAVNSIVHGYVIYGAKKAGLDPARDLTVSPMAPPAMLAALKSGQVDGFSMSRPWSSMAVQQGLGVRAVSSPLGDFAELNPFNYNVIITRPGFCESKPEVCRKLGAGFRKAVAFMHANPEEAIAILQKRFPKTDPEVLKDAYSGALAGTPRTPEIKESGFGTVEDYMIAAGIMKAEERLPSYAGLYTNAYVK
jgi:ABC-type nitrate/sulfonate/bicarbonate transport system substrate-binding protein